LTFAKHQSQFFLIFIAPTGFYTPELAPIGGAIPVGGLKNTLQFAAK